MNSVYVFQVTTQSITQVARLYIDSFLITLVVDMYRNIDKKHLFTLNKFQKPGITSTTNEIIQNTRQHLEAGTFLEQIANIIESK